MDPNMQYIFTAPDGFVCDLTLHVCQNDVDLNAFRQNVFYSVLQLGPFQVKRCEQSRDIIDFDGETNGRICIIDFGVRSDIEAICDLAIKRGARAFIAKNPPKTDMLVPIFLVPINTLEKMAFRPGALVNIQQKQTGSVKCDSVTVVHNGSSCVGKAMDGSESFPIDRLCTNESHPLVDESGGDIDLYYLSNLTPAGCGLSVPRYAVSLFSVNYETKRLISKTWELDAACCCRHVLVSEEKFKVVWISEVTRKKKNVKYIKENVKGCVCVCNFTDARIVSKVLDEAVHGKAVALCSATKPLTETNFPVFVVDDTFLDFIFYVESSEVMFDLRDLPVAKLDTDRDVPEVNHFSVHPSFPCSPVAMQPNFTEKTREETGKVQVGNSGEESNVDKCLKSKQHSSIDMIGTEPKYGLRNSMKNAGKELGNIWKELGNKGKAALNKLLFSTGPFLVHFDDFYKCYIQAFEKIESLDVEQAVRQGKEFMKAKTYKICLSHFAALAYLCTKSQSDTLVHELLRCLRQYEPSNQDALFLTMPKTKDSVASFEIPQKVLYNFFIRNIDSWTKNHEAVGSGFNKEVWKCVVLLSLSGLVRKQVVSDMQLLRQAINPTILADYRKRFYSALDKDTMMTLTLCFQKDFFGYIHALKSQTQSRPICLNKMKFDMLLHFIEDQLQKDISCATLLWKNLSELSDKIHLEKGSARKLINIFLINIGLKSFQAVNVLYDLIVTAVNCNVIVDCDVIASDIETFLIKTIFVSKNFDIEYVSHFYLLPISKFVRSIMHYDALTNYAVNAMTSESTFAKKLILIYLTYMQGRTCMGMSMNTKTELLLIECFKMLMSHGKSRFHLLCEIIQNAVSMPDLSLFSAEEHTMKEIASSTIRGCLPEIISRPRILRDIPDIIVEAQTFVEMIVELLQIGLQHHFKSVAEATKFYIEIFDSSCSTYSPLALHISQGVFHHALVKWEPHSVVDITEEHKLTMDVIFSESMPRNEITNKHHILIKKLVQTWTSSFLQGKVTSNQILRVIDSLDSKIWNTFETSTESSLPSTVVLQSTLDEVYEIEVVVRDMLTVCVDGEQFSLSHLLMEYCCDPPNDISRIMETYADDAAALSMMKTIEDFRNDHKFILLLIYEYGEIFDLCAYFLRHNSLLFRDAVYPKRGTSHTVATLARFVQDACKRIQSTIGPEMHYHGVVDAMKVLNTIDSVNSEIIVLKNSKLLITQTDTANFEIVALLCDLAVPLRQFVQCCDNFKFTVAADESLFAELKREVQQFYMADHNPIHICLRFFDQVLCFLCMNSTNSPFDKIEQLQATVPWITLLSDLSLHPELWNYVAEMKWFGDDGLKRFYDEYNNVTNVLLGNTQSYEMSVLTSLEPIVRIVSIVGKFKSSKTIFELFSSFDSNKDIRLAVREGTIANHIHQIHARLSEIKDWFGNGVNEVAASSAIFTKAMNCGKFTIVNDNSKHYLALVINEKHEKIVKSGADLDYFVSQLSLIQNESDVISSSMEGFIEQFQVLKAAYRNFITMDMVGFSSISTSDFVCRPGLDFLDEAKVLYRVTEEHLETFKTWLSQTRWRYKISMLFWTEELRDLNKVLTSTNDNVMLVAQYILSRLCPLWKKVLNVSHPAHLQFIVENIEHFHNNRSTSWLENVSRFIDACHVECANTTETLRGTGTSEIVLHSICCTTEDEKLCFFLVLGHIYKDRLPYVYEILDGSVPCSEDRFSLFLDRVKAFPTLKFTIVNAEKLHSKNLEALLLFLSDRRVESMCIRFYCIQRGDSLIHTSPWIEGKSWSLESLLPSSSCWNTAIEKYASVLVVASQNCSSGKTHFIRTKLKELESSVQSATLTIHEMSSVSTLVQALNLKFCNSRQTRALHVSLLYLPTGVSNERWLAEINHFFFSLIVLRHVYDPHLASSCSMSEKFCLFIEMPISTDAAHVWLKKNIPIVASCAEFPDIRIPFDVDQKARRVCTYLRAYDTGTIDRRYEGAANKRIVLVLDTSGSMEGSKFVSAIKNAISIFDSHIVEGDEFGVTLFDSSTYHVIPIQEVVGSNIEMMRQSLLNLTLYGGGTEMYSALAHTFTSLLHLNSTIDSWVVCLTDGESGMEDYGLLRELVAQSPENQHIVVVGIALSTQYEEAILYMCQRFSAGNVTAKGFFVRADSATSGIDEAFDVVKSKIPVSQTFDRDGAMSDDECRQYMAKYLPEFIDDDDMIAMSFWIRFLYRRVTVFDNNESFNYNETSENLGSSLMTIMLIEVERLLSENQQRDWQSESYIQLIYDFTSPKKPEFRLVCTAPNDIDPNLKEKLLSFHLPGFHIPTKQDLENRSSLDLFLSTAIGVPRHENEDGLLKIKCIDDHGFVLTLDFTMKLLSIHERIACQVPCVIEGETGVSKTALTKMYAILRNHGMTMNAQQKTADDLIEIEHQVTDEGFTLPDGFTSFERLDRAMDLDLQLAKRILVLIREKVKGRSPIFVDLPLLEEMDETSNGRQYLESFRKSTLEKSFFEINVDASLTEGDFIIMFDEVTTVATKIVDTDATVVVFLDEINTSTVLGLLKEIIIDRSISGKMLMDNIVIVGACNPPRTQIQTFSREQDKCKTWASGHYQVSELPPSLKK